MHRKIVVVDGQRAFVGGINYSADHLADFGPEAKQDYAVELTGPIVAAIHAFLRAGLGTWPQHTPRHAPLPAAPADAAAKPVDALFVTRDNHAHRNDIERHYRIAIRSARRRVLIANAYFFPGYRLLRELRRAARRGVEVRLVLQGEPDMAIVKAAASLLYDCLRRDGVHVHEYCKRPLHGKVAVVDDEWATVGSSNLDPLSLALNLEANVVLRGREFALDLAERLEQLIRDDCQEVVAPLSNRWGPWQSLRSAVIFHVLRRFPSWASWLPRHVPRLHVALPFSGGRAPHLPRGEAAAGTGERAHAR
jgi:cardiolipin synthase